MFNFIYRFTFRIKLIGRYILLSSKIIKYIFHFFFIFSKEKLNYDLYFYVRSFPEKFYQVQELLGGSSLKIYVLIHPSIKLKKKKFSNMKIFHCKSNFEFKKKFILNNKKKHLFVDDILQASFLVSQSNLTYLYLKDVFHGRNIDKFLEYFEKKILMETHRILLRDKRIPVLIGKIKNKLSKNILYDFLYNENKQNKKRRSKNIKVVLAGSLSENLLPVNVIKKLIEFSCEIYIFTPKWSQLRIYKMLKSINDRKNGKIFVKNPILTNNYYNILKEFDLGLCTFYNNINKKIYSRKFLQNGSSTKLADYIAAGLNVVIGKDYKYQAHICEVSGINYFTDEMLLRLNKKKFIEMINKKSNLNSKKIFNKHKKILKNFLNQ